MGAKGVKGLRQQMGSSEGLSARAAIIKWAILGRVVVAVGGQKEWTTQRTDAEHVGGTDAEEGSPERESGEAILEM